MRIFMTHITQRSLTLGARAYAKLSTWLLLGCINIPAWADLGDPTIGGADLGTTAMHLQSEFSQLKSMFYTGAQVIGICMVVGGLMQWRNQAKNPGHGSSFLPFVSIVIGALCFFVPLVIKMSASSILTNGY